MRTTILLVDDHKVFREGIRSLIEKNNLGQVLGEAENGAEAVRLADELKPDLVIMDMSIMYSNRLPSAVLIPRHQTTQSRCPTRQILATALVRSASEWVAISVKRRRLVPTGTVCGRIPWAKAPSARSASENSMVVSAGPMTIGTIWVVPFGSEKPASARLLKI
jgi:CheY-like chemotaxis protein